MNLPESDVRLFFRLYHSLLLYVNNRYKILDGLHRPVDLHKLNPEDLRKLKDILYGTPNLIDTFVKDNPENLPSEKLEFVSPWKNFVRDRFYIVRHLKNYTVFLDSSHPPKAYGVLGMITSFEEMMGPGLPIMVDATLLPFRNRIIYDGTLLSFNIIFGSGIRRSINDSYSQAKSAGIITTLPIPSDGVKSDDSDILRGYLKTEYSRDEHHGEIWELIGKNPDLMVVYCEEMGRVHARAYRKNLKAVGVVDGWFALIDGMIIAGGKTRDEVERIMKSLLPPEKIKLVYIFNLTVK
ncbi:MAG: hypothetical protein ACYDHX_00745 [Methanothrix sp.]